MDGLKRHRKSLFGRLRSGQASYPIDLYRGRSQRFLGWKVKLFPVRLVLLSGLLKPGGRGCLCGGAQLMSNCGLCSRLLIPAVLGRVQLLGRWKSFVQLLRRKVLLVLLFLRCEMFLPGRGLVVTDAERWQLVLLVRRRLLVLQRMAVSREEAAAARQPEPEEEAEAS